MNVVAAQPIAMIQRVDAPALALRANQRLIAEVLHVADDNVVLAIEGARVLARLTSPDQGQALAGQRFAQFVVRDLSSTTLSLQLLGHASGPETRGSPAPPAPAVLPSLLQLAGLPATPINLLLGQSLLQHGLPIEAETLAELAQALRDLPAWGEAEAASAASLRAAGLAPSPGAIRLLTPPPPSLSDAVPPLLDLLRQLVQTGRLSLDLNEAVHRLSGWLKGLLVDVSDRPATLVERLGRLIACFTARFGETTAPGPGQAPASLLTALLEARIALRQAGVRSALSAVDRVLAAVSFGLLANAPPEKSPAGGDWLSVEIPLRDLTAGPALGGQVCPAWLRIACRREAETRRVDPSNTHLMVSMEISGGQTLVVDLSLAGGAAAVQVQATSEELRGCAEDELTTLESGLGRLGYRLQSARCLVRPPTFFSRGPEEGGGPWREVDVET